jgi:ribose-phosphate pyrophosphokinase
VADLLRTAGADRVIAVDLHTAQIQGFFDGPVDHLFGLPLLAEYIERAYAGQPLTVVAPDSGRVRNAERWADRLGGCPLAFIHKTRDITSPGKVVANRVVGDVADRVCVIVDDEIQTGGTVCSAADLLHDAGAADVVVAVTHPVLPDPATERLKNSRISEVVVTNTLPLPPEKQFDKITVLSTAAILGESIQRIHTGTSVSSAYRSADRTPMP